MSCFSEELAAPAQLPLQRKPSVCSSSAASSRSTSASSSPSIFSAPPASAKPVHTDEDGFDAQASAPQDAFHRAMQSPTAVRSHSGEESAPEAEAVRFATKKSDLGLNETTGSSCPSPLDQGSQASSRSHTPRERPQDGVAQVGSVDSRTDAERAEGRVHDTEAADAVNLGWPPLPQQDAPWRLAFGAPVSSPTAGKHGASSTTADGATSYIKALDGVQRHEVASLASSGKATDDARHDDTFQRGRGGVNREARGDHSSVAAPTSFPVKNGGQPKTIRKEEEDDEQEPWPIRAAPQPTSFVEASSSMSGTPARPWERYLAAHRRSRASGDRVQQDGMTVHKAILGDERGRDATPWRTPPSPPPFNSSRDGDAASVSNDGSGFDVVVVRAGTQTRRPSHPAPLASSYTRGERTDISARTLFDGRYDVTDGADPYARPSRALLQQDSTDPSTTTAPPSALTGARYYSLEAPAAAQWHPLERSALSDRTTTGPSRFAPLLRYKGDGPSSSAMRGQSSTPQVSPSTTRMPTRQSPLASRAGQHEGDADGAVHSYLSTRSPLRLWEAKPAEATVIRTPVEGTHVAARLGKPPTIAVDNTPLASQRASASDRHARVALPLPTPLQLSRLKTLRESPARLAFRGPLPMTHTSAAEAHKSSNDSDDEPLPRENQPVQTASTPQRKRSTYIVLPPPMLAAHADTMDDTHVDGDRGDTKHEEGGAHVRADWLLLQRHLRHRTHTSHIQTLDLSRVCSLSRDQWCWLSEDVLPQLRALEVLLLRDMRLTDAHLTVLVHGCQMDTPHTEGTVLPSSARPAALRGAEEAPLPAAFYYRRRTSTATGTTMGVEPPSSAACAPRQPSAFDAPLTSSFSSSVKPSVTRVTSTSPDSAAQSSAEAPTGRASTRGCLPHLRVLDVSGNALTHQSATTLGRVVLWAADTLDELRLARNPLGDDGFHTLAIYLAACTTESLSAHDGGDRARASRGQWEKADKRVARVARTWTARLSRALREQYVSLQSAHEAGSLSEEAFRASVAALHMGPSLLDVRACGATVRGVSTLLAGASAAHRLATIALSFNAPLTADATFSAVIRAAHLEQQREARAVTDREEAEKDRADGETRSAIDGHAPRPEMVLWRHNTASSSLLPAREGGLPVPAADESFLYPSPIVTSGVLLTYTPFSNFDELRAPSALRRIGLRGLPLSQMCTPVGVRELLLNVFVSCDALDVLDMSDTFEIRLVAEDVRAALSQSTARRQTWDDALMGSAQLMGWQRFLEAEGEVEFTMSSVTVAGQTCVGDVAMELFAHAAFNAQARAAPLPAAFRTVCELHLAASGITDEAIRGLCVAVKNAAQSGMLASLRVLDVSRNMLTVVGCDALLQAVVRDWPALESPLEAVALEQNDGLPAGDQRVWQRLHHTAIACLARRLRESLTVLNDPSTKRRQDTPAEAGASSASASGVQPHTCDEPPTVRPLRIQFGPVAGPLYECICDTQGRALTTFPDATDTTVSVREGEAHVGDVPTRGVPDVSSIHASGIVDTVEPPLPSPLARNTRAKGRQLYGARQALSCTRQRRWASSATAENEGEEDAAIDSEGVGQQTPFNDSAYAVLGPLLAELSPADATSANSQADKKRHPIRPHSNEDCPAGGASPRPRTHPRLIAQIQQRTPAERADAAAHASSHAVNDEEDSPLASLPVKPDDEWWLSTPRGGGRLVSPSPDSDADAQEAPRTPTARRSAGRSTEETPLIAAAPDRLSPPPRFTAARHSHTDNHGAQTSSRSPMRSSPPSKGWLEAVATARDPSAVTPPRQSRDKTHTEDTDAHTPANSTRSRVNKNTADEAPEAQAEAPSPRATSVNAGLAHAVPLSALLQHNQEEPAAALATLHDVTQRPASGSLHEANSARKRPSLLASPPSEPALEVHGTDAVMSADGPSTTMDEKTAVSTGQAAPAAVLDAAARQASDNPAAINLKLSSSLRTVDSAARSGSRHRPPRAVRSFTLTYVHPEGHLFCRALHVLQKTPEEDPIGAEARAAMEADLLCALQPATDNSPSRLVEVQTTQSGGVLPGPDTTRTQPSSSLHRQHSILSDVRTQASTAHSTPDTGELATSLPESLAVVASVRCVSLCDSTRVVGAIRFQVTSNEKRTVVAQRLQACLNGTLDEQQRRFPHLLACLNRWTVQCAQQPPEQRTAAASAQSGPQRRATLEERMRLCSWDSAVRLEALAQRSLYAKAVLEEQYQSRAIAAVHTHHPAEEMNALLATFGDARAAGVDDAPSSAAGPSASETYNSAPTRSSEEDTEARRDGDDNAECVSTVEADAQPQEQGESVLSVTPTEETSAKRPLRTSAKASALVVSADLPPAAAKLAGMDDASGVPAPDGEGEIFTVVGPLQLGSASDEMATLRNPPFTAMSADSPLESAVREGRPAVNVRKESGHDSEEGPDARGQATGRQPAHDALTVRHSGDGATATAEDMNTSIDVDAMRKTSTTGEMNLSSSRRRRPDALTGRVKSFLLSFSHLEGTVVCRAWELLHRRDDLGTLARDAMQKDLLVVLQPTGGEDGAVDAERGVRNVTVEIPDDADGGAGRTAAVASNLLSLRVETNERRGDVSARLLSISRPSAFRGSPIRPAGLVNNSLADVHVSQRNVFPHLAAVLDTHPTWDALRVIETYLSASPMRLTLRSHLMERYRSLATFFHYHHSTMDTLVTELGASSWEALQQTDTAMNPAVRDDGSDRNGGRAKGTTENRDKANTHTAEDGDTSRTSRASASTTSTDTHSIDAATPPPHAATRHVDKVRDQGRTSTDEKPPPELQHTAAPSARQSHDPMRTAPRTAPPLSHPSATAPHPRQAKPANPASSATPTDEVERERLLDQRMRRLLRLTYEGTVHGGGVALDESKRQKQLVGKGKWGLQRVAMTIEWGFLFVLYFEKKHIFGGRTAAPMLIHPLMDGFQCLRADQAGGESDVLIVRVARRFSPEEVGVSRLALEQRLHSNVRLTIATGTKRKMKAELQRMTKEERENVREGRGLVFDITAPNDSSHVATTTGAAPTNASSNPSMLVQHNASGLLAASHTGSSLPSNGSDLSFITHLTTNAVVDAVMRTCVEVRVTMKDASSVEEARETLRNAVTRSKEVLQSTPQRSLSKNSFA